MTTNLDSWARPELICETDWLAEHIDDEDVVVLDCDLLDAYLRLHIPARRLVALALLEDRPARRLADARHVRSGAVRAAPPAGWGSGPTPRWWRTTVRARCTRRARGGRSTASVTPTSGFCTADSTSGTPKAARCRVRICARRWWSIRLRRAPRDDSICRLDEIPDAIADRGHVFWDVRSEAEWSGANRRGHAARGAHPGCGASGVAADARGAGSHAEAGLGAACDAG